MITASAIMGFIAYVALQFMQLQSNDLRFFLVFPKFALITALGFIVYIWLCKLMKVEEVDPILRKLSSIIFSKIPGRRQ